MLFAYRYGLVVCAEMSCYLHGCMTGRALIALPFFFFFFLSHVYACVVVGLPIQYVLFAVLLLVVSIVC